MNCDQARNWLLHSDDPRPEACASAEVAAHLAGCGPCREFAAQVAQLEKAYRELPAPASAEPARLTFLDKLPRPAAPRKALPLPQRVARWAVAALLLLVAGTLLWSFVNAPQAQAGPAVIDRLVDWNLDLAQAADANERGRIYTTNEAALRSAVARTQFAPADQELAGLLLDNGAWLAQHDDPIDTAERFSAVADKLVERLEVAAQGKDRAGVDRFAKLQGKVSKRGLEPHLARAQDTGALNFDREGRLEKMVLRDSKRMNQLVDLLERNPDLSRKEIRQALDIPTKAGKNHAELAIDLEAPAEPVAVGQMLNWTVKLRNQGPALNKVQVLVSLDDDMEVMGAKGPTGHRQEGSQVIFKQLGSLARGGEATFEIKIKAVRSGSGKCRAEVRAKQHGFRPVWREQTLTIED